METITTPNLNGSFCLLLGNHLDISTGTVYYSDVILLFIQEQILCDIVLYFFFNYCFSIKEIARIAK